MLSWSTSPSHWDIVIPSQVAFGADIPPIAEGVDLHFDAGAWDKREDRAVWRGVTTGEQSSGGAPAAEPAPCGGCGWVGEACEGGAPRWRAFWLPPHSKSLLSVRLKEGCFVLPFIPAGCLGIMDHSCRQNAQTWNATVRPRLVQMCKDRSDLCDAKIVGEALLGCAPHRHMRQHSHKGPLCATATVAASSLGAVALRRGALAPQQRAGLLGSRLLPRHS